MSDLSEDDEDLAKKFRKALNARRRPSAKKSLSTSSSWRNHSEGVGRSSMDSSHNLESFTANAALENEPVYRELPDGNPTIWNRIQAQVFPQPIYNAIKPPLGRAAWKKFWEVHLPIWHWLYYYVPKFLIGDIVAGLTIGVTHIPQGIGFALLAMVPPVFGLYSSFVPVVLYSIFGTSRHLSVGTFPIVALMTANAVNRVSLSACGDGDSASGLGISSNETGDCGLDQCEEIRVSVAITLSMMVGVIMIIMSFLKLGFVSLFLSDALISGYTAAAAFSIVVTQISNLFGIQNATVEDGWFVTPRRVIKYVTRIVYGDLTPAAIVTSIICFIILITIELTNRFVKKKFKKFPVYIPGQLIVVILATGISYGAMLNEKYDLQIINNVGGIPSGKCYAPTVPSSSLIGDLFTDAVVIAIIGFALNIAQAKLLATKNGYTIYPDQELFAYGIMNLGGSFFGSIPTAGALSRTVLQDAVGGNTQLVGLISSFLVLFVILVLGFLFGHLPNAAVAVIVVMALKGLLFQVRDVRKYYHLHWPDMFVWLVVFAATLIFRLDIGLMFGIAFSILTIVVRTILPFSPGLGEAAAWVYPHGRARSVYEYEEDELKVHRLPNIYVFQFNAPLYFANCGVFRSRLLIECGLDPHVFDKPLKSCFTKCHQKISNQSWNYTQHKETGSEEEMQDSQPTMTGFATSDNGDQFEEDISKTKESQDGSDDHQIATLQQMKSLTEDEFFSLAQPQATDFYHTIILDCGPIGFVDSMGAAMLEKIVTEFDAVNIQVLLAAPNTPVCDALNRYCFFKRFSAERLFPSVTSAVHYAKCGHKVPAIEEPQRLEKKLASNLERQLAFPVRPTLFELSTVEQPKGPSSLYKVVSKQTETTV